VTKAYGRPRKGRLPDLGIQPPADTFWEPYREGALQDSIRVDYKSWVLWRQLWWDGKLLVDFAMSLQRQRGGEMFWRNVLRVDCCHQKVHAHHFDYDGRETCRAVLRPIRVPEDLVVGLAQAEQIADDLIDATA
jgi:hypothetical protein